MFNLYNTNTNDWYTKTIKYIPSKIRHYRSQQPHRDKTTATTTNRRIVVLLLIIVVIIVFEVILYKIFGISTLFQIVDCDNNKGTTLYHITTPRIALSNETAAICAVAKYETPYLEEWIDYHVGLGFHSIYIYDNTDRYELQDWLRGRHHLQTRVRIFHNPGWGKQCSSYEACTQLALEHHHTWVLFHDIDEFLVMKENYDTYRDYYNTTVIHNDTTTTITTNEFTNNATQHYHYYDADNIVVPARRMNVVDFAKLYLPNGGSLSLNWEIFGTAHRNAYEPLPVLKRFQCRVVQNYTRNRYIKSLVHLPSRNLSEPCFDPHIFALNEGTYRYNTDGIITDGESQQWGGPTNVASLYHFIFKSYEEYVEKRQRGAGFFGNYTIADLVPQAINHTGPDGAPIPNGTIYDPTAWNKLKAMVPKYRLYDNIEYF